MIISAYTIETDVSGFTRCWWPATSLRNARRLARELSEKLAEDKRYRGAFWIVREGAKRKNVTKYWRGIEYAPSAGI